MYVWQPREIDGSFWELDEGTIASNSTTTPPESKSWQAFADEPKPQPSPVTNQPKSVRTIKGYRNAQNSNGDTWGFGQDNFKATRGGGFEISRTSTSGNTSLRFGDSKGRGQKQTQPAGWAGF